MLRVSVCVIGLAFTAPAQPALSGAVNAASYMPPGMPSSAIAQGSLFSVFGTNLGPASYTVASSFPLPTNLAGTTLSVTVKGVTKPAILLSAGQYQINAILPSDIPAGTGTLTATVNGQASGALQIQVTSAAFGIFTFASSGIGQAVVTDPSYVPNSVIHTFHPGDVAILWGTGLGPINGSDAGLPPTGTLPGNIQVIVGNSAAQVSYHGRSGCCAGVDQIVFTVPPGVDGCSVPVSVQANGQTSNFPTIAVSSSGNTCSDSPLGSALLDKLASGQDVAFSYIRLEDAIMRFQKLSLAASYSDFATATFSRYSPSTAGLAQYGVSSGYCIAVPCPGFRCAVNGAYTLTDMSPANLDAGSALSLASGGPIPVPKVNGAGEYWAILNSNTNPRYLWPGAAYSVSGTGGKSVGAFSVSGRGGLAGVQFTNVTATQAIPRNAAFTVQWSGGDPSIQSGQVTLGGYSAADSTYIQLTYFQCQAPASAGQLTIPASILSMLPATGTGQSGSITYPLGWLWIGQYDNPVSFSAPGLDSGIITDIFFNGFGVYFQ